jgi:hypothetical protein
MQDSSVSKTMRHFFPGIVERESAKTPSRNNETSEIRGFEMDLTRTHLRSKVLISALVSRNTQSKPDGRLSAP